MGTRGKAFDHKKVESKWQNKWEREKICTPVYKKGGKKPFYNLWMFPYPSAEGLHAGHAFSSTGDDVYGRFMRMRGENTFQPFIGFDSFGIHSENYALKTGTHPIELIDKTTKNYCRQLKSLGHGYDFTRSVTTSDPDFYKWTQWLFTQMFEAGLAYRKMSEVNWCPSCKTVLADEQVMSPAQAGKDPKDASGNPIEDREGLQVCERCGTEVEKKNLKQWMFRITDYADRLLENQKKLDWPEKVKLGQRNWIGKKEGIDITYDIEGTKEAVTVWTSRPDTNFGATFVVLAPEHPLATKIATKENKNKVAEYVEKAKKKSKEERIAEGGKKTGVFTGAYAINHLTKKRMPIWVTDFVLADVGTGAVVGVPGHDVRDFEFAKEYGLEIVPVVVKSEELNELTNRQEKFIIEIFKEANNSDKLLILKGGWGIETFSKKIIRNHDDVDFHFENKDIDFWKEWLEKRGFSKKEGIVFEKDDLKIDFEGVELNGKEIFWDDGNKSDKDEVYESVDWNGIKINRFKRNVEIYVKRKKKLRLKDVTDLFILGDKDIIDDPSRVQEKEGVMVNSGFLNGMDIHVATKEIMDYMEKRGWGKRVSNYHLRDWLLSRQRYWGTPIPMIYCEKCAKEGKSWFTENQLLTTGHESLEISKIKDQSPESKDLYFKGTSFKGLHRDQSDWDHAGWYAVPESDLPVKLPEISDYKPSGDGRGPLDNHPEFYEVKCPACGAKAKRETDVADTFLDSSWYFLRYPTVGMNNADKIAFDKEITNAWLPLDLYFGGAEHTVLHLMYARFVTMVLNDLGYLKFDEPFPRFYAHGLMIKDGAKMSKSRGNVINPDEYVEKYGADTLRMYMMFMGPMDGFPDFRDTGIEGMRRFIDKLWNTLQMKPSDKLDKSLAIKMHQTIKKVTEDIQSFRYNTAIAAIMEYVNELRSEIQNSKIISQDDNLKVNNKKKESLEFIEYLKTLALLIAPFAPHLAEEVWVNVLGQKFSIHTTSWPNFDPKLVKEEKVTIPVQINGKLRSTIEIDREKAIDKGVLLTTAKSDEKVEKWLDGKIIKKEIFVPGKLVNFVV